jgi:hypothetical protein
MSKTKKDDYAKLFAKAFLQEEAMSVQTVESYRSFESYDVIKAKQPAVWFPRIVFATVVGIGYVIAIAAFLYPVYMHIFVYD